MKYAMIIYSWVSYHMKYCTLVVSVVEIEEQYYRDHHLYHRHHETYHKYVVMILLSLFQSGMPPQAVALHQ